MPQSWRPDLHTGTVHPIIALLDASMVNLIGVVPAFSKGELGDKECIQGSSPGGLSEESAAFHAPN